MNNKLWLLITLIYLAFGGSMNANVSGSYTMNVGGTYSVTSGAVTWNTPRFDVV